MAPIDSDKAPVLNTGAPSPDPTKDSASSKAQPEFGTQDSVRLEAVKRYRQGWQVIPLRVGTKLPVDDGWPDQRFTSEAAVERAFPVGDPGKNIAQRNLGVVLGGRPQLVCVDLDAANPTVAALALPATDLIDGRPGSPRSHWFYQVAGKGRVTKEALKSPLVERPLVELLGDGQQVVLPPSFYAEKGENRAWIVDGEPALIEADELQRAVRRAAAFSELVLLWQRLDGQRHDASLPLVGGLLRSGVEPETIEALLHLMWDGFDPDPKEIYNAVWDTVEKRDSEQPFTGWKAFREGCAEELWPSVDRILSWLGVDPDDRPVIVTGPGMMDRATEDAWNALKLRNDPAFLFARSGDPVRVELDEKNRALIRELTPERMRYHLNNEIRWLKSNIKGDLVKADATLELAKNVLAAPSPKLPPLTTVTVAPILGPDGELLTTPGYHPSSQTYYQPLHGYTVPAVSDVPSAEEVERAKKLLMHDFLGNFPFESDVEKANALALTLLPFGRNLIAGPTPLHWVEAPERGTGKSLLADTITKLLCGPAGVASITETTDEEEWRKKITTSLLSGSPFVYIDNVDHELNSPNLASALTRTQWKDRLLGASKDVVLDVRVVWIATANNAKLNIDNGRRSVRIRLNANAERPWLRGPENYIHPDLSLWVDENWGELVWSCLTLWRAWVAVGRPKGNAVLGSFERWAETMSGLLGVIGVPGLLGNQEEFMDLATDRSRSRWSDLVERWWARFGTSEVRPGELYREVAVDVGGFDYPSRAGVESSLGSRLTKFGTEMSSERDRVYGQFKIAVRVVKDKPVYRLVHLRGEERSEADWLFEEALWQRLVPSSGQ